MNKNVSLANMRDPYSSLRYPEFRLLLIGRFITSFGNQMLSVAIGWELWIRTHSAFSLGMIGLVQVVPVILLSLPAGHVADQFNRKKIVLYTQILLGLCSLGLAYLSYTTGPIILIYFCLLGIGIARAFNDPASATLVPQTVPPEIFTNAATWSNSSWQVASIAGPAVAGLVAAVFTKVSVIYLFDFIAAIVFLVMINYIKGRPLALSKTADTLESLAEGLRFMRSSKVILAAITLDMFAVLFGGAVTLLPIYATDILKVGSQGLGWMRAAPSVGSVIMAFILTHLPPFKRAGRTLLLAVAGFGLATIIFGLSSSFWLSMAMLVLLGALDNISVIIRGTLVLTRTPDEMRGRISSVNSIFIGISNELGGFESGLAAALLGPIISVVGGGFMTVLIVIIIARIWPEIREMTTLDVPLQEITL